MLDVNCHNCGSIFQLDEYLLEFYFVCEVICPACTKKETQPSKDLSDCEGLPAVL